jgi:linoleate 10R-lipoxygenase
VAQDTREVDHEVSPRGQGNVVSIEFNLLYRWHATTSEHDERITTELFSRLFHDFDLKTVRCFLRSPYTLISYSLTDHPKAIRGERSATLESWKRSQEVGVWRVCGVVQMHQKGDAYTQPYSIKRDGSGRFSDADLARLLQDATEARASAYKARGTPEALRVIELLGIEEARRWGTCTVRVLQMCLTGFSSYCSS